MAAKLSDAAFLASCVPEAAIEAADSNAALWRAKSRFSFVSARIETALTIVERSVPDSVSFELVNRMPGATLGVNCTMAFSDTADGTLVAWSAEIVARTGLLKAVPVAVLRTQIEIELADLWRGVRTALAR